MPNKPSVARVYINDIACLASGAKAYVAPKGKGVVLTVSDPSIAGEVQAALVEAGIMKATDTLAKVPFARFESRVQVPGKPGGNTAKPRAAARSMPGTRDGEASALDLSSIPVPDPVVLRIDHREPEALFAAFKGLTNVTVERVELPLGDIEINGKYIIERKCCTETTGRTDFEASVVDESKRLFFQSEKLRLEEGIVPIILLEGNAHENSCGMLVQAVDGMLSYLLTIQKMNVLTTYNLSHTVYFLLKLAAHDRSGLGYEPPLRGKKPRQQQDQLIFVLEGLPGVSAGTARKLAVRFGSLAGLVAASEEELLLIPGMGPKRVAQVRAVLFGEGSS
ncbi:helix-hairpin-helix domain-containing protein [Vreelandella rituensis]|nr:helix-hairpin-helix domain-containing protein [Halomonas rituensis]